MRHPPLAPGWIDRPHRRCALGDLALESGETLRDAFVSYVIHGDESRLRDVPILVTSAIGSTHHRLDFLIGPGAALDSERHCIVAVDALGNGLSSSPSNSALQPQSRFPRFTIRDMVESQRRLLDHLGVGRLFAVAGASMGGMQALQWAVSHPARVERVVAMTPMARTSRWSQLVNELSRRALFVDGACRVPRPRDEAMRLWAPLTQQLMARTPEALEAFATHEALLHALDERGCSVGRRSGRLRLVLPDVGLRPARRRHDAGMEWRHDRRARVDPRRGPGARTELRSVQPGVQPARGRGRDSRCAFRRAAGQRRSPERQRVAEASSAALGAAIDAFLRDRR